MLVSVNHSNEEFFPVIGSTFVAENVSGLTIQGLEQDSLEGNFPGGTGRFREEDGNFWLENPVFAYCYIEFINDLAIIHDRCYDDQIDYQVKMLSYLKKVCGGKVGVWSEYFLDTDDAPNTAEKITKEYPSWRQPGEEAE